MKIIITNKKRPIKRRPLGVYALVRLTALKFKQPKFKIKSQAKKLMKAQIKKESINKLIESLKKYIEDQKAIKRKNTIKVTLRERENIIIAKVMEKLRNTTVNKTKLVKKLLKKLEKLLEKRRKNTVNKQPTAILKKYIKKKKPIINEKTDIEKKKVKKTILPQKWKTILVLNNIKSFSWTTGEVVNKRNRNLTVLRNYVIGIRYNHAIYNIHLLLIRLRIVLNMLCQRAYYKKRCLINYAQNPALRKKKLKTLGVENFAKRMFMVTWKNWLGGVLTNFKTIAKRIIAKTKNKYFRQATEKLYVSYVKNIPRMPSFVISTSNSHWALNETQHLRLNHLQLVNTTHLGDLGNLTLGMNTQYYSLRSFTMMLEECISSVRQKRKFFHKSRMIRHVNKIRNKYQLHTSKLNLTQINEKSRKLQKYVTKFKN